MATQTITPSAAGIVVSTSGSVRRVTFVSTSDSFAAGDAAVRERVVDVSQSDTVTVGDVYVRVAVIDRAVSDTFTVGDAASIVGRFNADAESTFLVSSSAYYDGQDADVWTLNIASNAVGRYTEFSYKGIVQVNGRTFVLGDDGIFEMTGAMDNGNNLDVFVEGAAQRVEEYVLIPRYAYVIGKIPENKAQPALGLKFDVIDDEENRYEYDFDSTESAKQVTRVVFGRGIRSRHMSYAIKGDINEPAEISSVDVYIDETRRGIK